MTNLQSLDTLRLNSNPFGDEGLRILIRNLTNLKRIGMTNLDAVSDDALSDCSQWQSLETFPGNGNGLSFHIMETAGSLTNLTSLDWKHPLLVDNNLIELKNHYKLKVLSLGGEITGSGFEHLFHLNIRELNLVYCKKLDPSTLETLGQMISLRILRLVTFSRKHAYHILAIKKLPPLNLTIKVSTLNRKTASDDLIRDLGVIGVSIQYM